MGSWHDSDDSVRKNECQIITTSEFDTQFNKEFWDILGLNCLFPLCLRRVETYYFKPFVGIHKVIPLYWHKFVQKEIGNVFGNHRD